MSSNLIRLLTKPLVQSKAIFQTSRPIHSTSHHPPFSAGASHSRFRMCGSLKSETLSMFVRMNYQMYTDLEATEERTEGMRIAKRLESTSKFLKLVVVIRNLGTCAWSPRHRRCQKPRFMATPQQPRDQWKRWGWRILKICGSVKHKVANRHMCQNGKKM